MTLYLQKRDERRGARPLGGGDDDSVGGNDGASVAVKTSGSGKRDYQDDAD